MKLSQYHSYFCLVFTSLLFDKGIQRDRLRFHGDKKLLIWDLDSSGNRDEKPYSVCLVTSYPCTICDLVTVQNMLGELNRIMILVFRTASFFTVNGELSHALSGTVKKINCYKFGRFWSVGSDCYAIWLGGVYLKDPLSTFKNSNTWN